MKTAFYLELGNMQSEEIKDLIMFIGCTRSINCTLSDHCIDYKGDKLLLIALTEGDKMELDLWSYNDLAELGQEGYKLVSAKDKFIFMHELIQGDYKYFK